MKFCYGNRPMFSSLPLFFWHCGIFTIWEKLLHHSSRLSYIPSENCFSHSLIYPKNTSLVNLTSHLIIFLHSCINNFACHVVSSGKENSRPIFLYFFPFLLFYKVENLKSERVQILLETQTHYPHPEKFWIYVSLSGGKIIVIQFWKKRTHFTCATCTFFPWFFFKCLAIVHRFCQQLSKNCFNGLIITIR